MTRVGDRRMVAECPNCGKTVNVRWPYAMTDDGFVDRGDGTMFITYWHKNPETGKDCRAEVDYFDARDFKPVRRAPQPVSPSSADRLSPAQQKCLEAVRSGAVVCTGIEGDAKVQYGFPGEDRWVVLHERSMRALLDGGLINLADREYGEAVAGHPRFWSEEVAISDDGRRALENTQTPPSDGDQMT